MNKIHYAWVVCILGALLIFINMGFVSNGFSVFLPFIMDEYGLSGAQTSSLVTIRCIVSFGAMLGIGYFYRIFSIRTGTAIAAGLAGTSFLIYSFARTYRMFCIGAAITGLTYGLGSMIPISILMGRWFVKRRAFAVGTCAAGTGIATTVLPAVSTMLVEQFSLQKAFLYEGIAIFILTAAILFFLRNDPEDMGLSPLGEGEEQEGEISQKGKAADGVYKMNGKEWLLIGGVCISMGALTNPAFSHLSVLFTTEGFPSMTVALIMSAVGIVMTFSKMGFGQVADRIGGKRSSILFTGIFIAGNLFCCLAFLGNMPITVLTVLLMGIGFPIATVGPAVWAGDLAASCDYAKTVRRLQVIYAAGALAFANVPGFLYDHFGSYIPAYIVFTFITALSLLLIVIVYRANGRRRAELY